MKLTIVSNTFGIPQDHTQESIDSDITFGMAAESDPTVQVNVERLRSICDPLKFPPWMFPRAGELRSIERIEVLKAVLAGRLKETPYKQTFSANLWSRSDHIERIAYLYVNPPTEPIVINVGTDDGDRPYWVIDNYGESNHMFAAVLCNSKASETIKAVVIGSAARRNTLL